MIRIYGMKILFYFQLKEKEKSVIVCFLKNHFPVLLKFKRTSSVFSNL